jgi:transposase
MCKNGATAWQKAYDAGKKAPGVKRHITVDTQGFSRIVTAATADVTDRSGVLEALGQGLRDSAIQKVLVDGGCTGEPFAQAVREKPGAIVEVVKRGRLWKNGKRKLHSS